MGRNAMRQTKFWIRTPKSRPGHLAAGCVILTIALADVARQLQALTAPVDRSFSRPQRRQSTQRLRRQRHHFLLRCHTRSARPDSRGSPSQFGCTLLGANQLSQVLEDLGKSVRSSAGRTEEPFALQPGVQHDSDGSNQGQPPSPRAQVFLAPVNGENGSRRRRDAPPTPARKAQIMPNASGGQR